MRTIITDSNGFSISGHDAIVMPDREKLFEYRENKYLVVTVNGSVMWFRDYIDSFDAGFYEKYKIFLDDQPNTDRR